MTEKSFSLVRRLLSKLGDTIVANPNRFAIVAVAFLVFVGLVTFVTMNPAIGDGVITYDETTPLRFLLETWTYTVLPDLLDF